MIYCLSTLPFGGVRSTDMFGTCESKSIGDEDSDDIAPDDTVCSVEGRCPCDRCYECEFGRVACDVTEVGEPFAACR